MRRRSLRWAFIGCSVLALFTEAAWTAGRSAASNQSDLAQAVTVKLTSFNIRWYGLNGSMTGDPGSETRDLSVRDFMNRHVFPTDVVAFQEIVDVRRLERLLPSGVECVSYEGAEAKHQHVVLCASEKYRLIKVAHDDNFTIEEVAINSKSRPAVRADLADRRTGRRVMRIVAVHLKAFPDESEARIYQSRRIGEDLSRAEQDLPTVILGDFNTYSTSNNGQAQDDVKLIEGALQAEYRRDPLRFLPHEAGVYTYRNKNRRSQFDQFYFSGSLRPIGRPVVFPICSSTSEGQGYLNSKFYYEKVSDHCPAAIQFQLPVVR